YIANGRGHHRFASKECIEQFRRDLPVRRSRHPRWNDDNIRSGKYLGNFRTRKLLQNTQAFRSELPLRPLQETAHESISTIDAREKQSRSIGTGTGCNRLDQVLNPFIEADRTYDASPATSTRKFDEDSCESSAFTWIGGMHEERTSISSLQPTARKRDVLRVTPRIRVGESLATYTTKSSTQEG